jgi:hypothetical protein
VAGRLGFIQARRLGPAGWPHAAVAAARRRIKFAFLKSSLTLQPQTPSTMLQTRYFFGYYYFYAAA